MKERGLIILDGQARNLNEDNNVLTIQSDTSDPYFYRESRDAIHNWVQQSSSDEVRRLLVDAFCPEKGYHCDNEELLNAIEHRING